MRKLLLPLLLFAGITFAQCTGYVQNAQNYDAQETSYPSAFGAGLEYLAAARCVRAEDSTAATTYYLLAASRFITAAGLLVPGGDHSLRGGSYEKAGDAYYETAMLTESIEYYSKARLEYLAAGATSDVARIDEKIAATTGEEAVPPNAFLFGALILLILFVCIVIILSFRHKYPIEKELLEETGFKRPEIKELHTTPKTPSVEELSPKERAKEKLMRKYRGYR